MVKLLGEMDADIQDEEWIQIHKQKRKLPGLKSEIRRLQKTLRFSQVWHVFDLSRLLIE